MLYAYVSGCSMLSYSFVVFFDGISKASEDRLIASLYFAVGLRMVRRSVKTLTSSKVHKVAKNLLVGCTSISVRRYLEMPYGTSSWSGKKFAFCINVVWM